MSHEYVAQVCLVNEENRNVRETKIDSSTYSRNVCKALHYY